MRGSVRGDFSLAHELTGHNYDLFKAGKLSGSTRPPATAENITRYDSMHCEENNEDARRAIKSIFSPEEIQDAAGRFPKLFTYLAAAKHLESCVALDNEQL